MSKEIKEALDPIFKPNSIAVIGASNNPGWGYGMVRHPLESGYKGELYPINPHEEEIAGLKVYRSVLDVPADIDLAVIVVREYLVPQVMEECVEKGVKGAVIISAGFAETGERGAKLQDQVKKIADKGGIRFVGPNCMGIINMDVKLNIAFWEPPIPGPITFISQSGTFGGYIYRTATQRGYGLSKFVSSGNQASISETDYLEYFADDPNTKSILFYLEGVRDGRRFIEVARETVRKKPVIVYKAGRTGASVRAARSHTGSIAGSNEIFEAACKQAGVIRVYEALHPFLYAEATLGLPLPKGNRMAIMSGGGGYCVSTAEFAEASGLEVPEFDEETTRKLKRILVRHASPPKNPIDFAGGQRTPYQLVRCAELCAQLDYIDGIIMMGMGEWGRIFDLRMLIRAGKIAERIAAIPRKYGKPIVCTGTYDRNNPISVIIHNAGIPYLQTPEDTVRAMVGLVKYAEARRRLGESDSSWKPYERVAPAPWR